MSDATDRPIDNGTDQLIEDILVCGPGVGSRLAVHTHIAAEVERRAASLAEACRGVVALVEDESLDDATVGDYYDARRRTMDKLRAALAAFEAGQKGGPR